MRGIALILAFALFTGCIGGDKTDEPLETADDTSARDAPAAPGASTPPSPSASPARPTATSGAGAPANASVNESAPPMVSKIAYEWSSTLNPEACVPVAVLGCAGLLDNANWFDRPSIAGKVTHATLDLAWTAESTGASELRFVLVDAVACEGDGCWEGETIAEVSGASPLALDADVALAADHFLVVAVRPASMTPAPLYGFVHTEQSFSVTGEWTLES